MVPPRSANPPSSTANTRIPPVAAPVRTLRKGLGPSKISNTNTHKHTASSTRNTLLNATADPTHKPSNVSKEKSVLHDLKDADQLSKQPVNPETRRQLRPARIFAWVQNAASIGMLESVHFWGDILLKLSDDPVHVWFVCQILQLKCEFTHAVQLVLSNPKAMKDRKCRSILAQCLMSLNQNEDALQYLDDKTETVEESQLPEQSTTKTNPINIRAYNLYLKGKIQYNSNEKGRAKQSYLEALRLDVRCFEAFLELNACNLLSMSEETSVLESLPFAQHCGEEDAQFVRLIYFIHFRLFGRISEMESALHTLEGPEYGVASMIPVLQCRADLFAMKRQNSLALEKTNQILTQDPLNDSALKTHISVLYTTKASNDLFLLSHSLIRSCPDRAVAWHAIGCYYLLQSSQPLKMEEARKAFAKACRLDDSFSNAWIGMGHALRAEGNFDEALNAYSSASKCALGSHEPTLYMGMLYIHLGQSTLGEEYIRAAKLICNLDSMVENELGCIAFYRKEYLVAISHFIKSLKLAGKEAARTELYSSTWCNLGSAYKCLSMYSKAKTCFWNCLAIDPKSSVCLANLAYVEDRLGNFDEALTYYHDALALDPDNSLYVDLMNVTLSRSLNAGFDLIRNDPLLDNVPPSAPSTHADTPPWMSKFSSTFHDPDASLSAESMMADASFNMDLESLQKPSQIEAERIPAQQQQKQQQPLKLRHSVASMLESDGDEDSAAGTPIVPMRKGLLFGVKRDTHAGTLLLGDLTDSPFGSVLGAGSSSSSSARTTGPSVLPFAVPHKPKVPIVSRRTLSFESFSSSSPASGSSSGTPFSVANEAHVARNEAPMVFSFGQRRAEGAAVEDGRLPRRLSPARNVEGRVGVMIRSGAVSPDSVNEETRGRRRSDAVFEGNTGYESEEVNDEDMDMEID
ncbi:anaphase promoting complex subunit cdc16 [Chytriomyces hyalinus]|nr:anaphase promoting complex subunit cdc16 [Chytriomyces hyalinus]